MTTTLQFLTSENRFEEAHGLSFNFPRREKKKSILNCFSRKNRNLTPCQEAFLESLLKIFFFISLLIHGSLTLTSHLLRICAPIIVPVQVEALIYLHTVKIHFFISSQSLQ